uniref:Uncharacterized protein LOC111122691 n=1 Tax=Crassostrea virginica TaxID=6565 RepID=A0A8B8CWV3_CRAVI|nr:uncharacterized protein LOC111122691 [Crassostrea virginica]
MSSAGISLSILIVLYLSWYVDAACVTQLGKLQVNKERREITFFCSYRGQQWSSGVMVFDDVCEKCHCKDFFQTCCAYGSGLISKEYEGCSRVAQGCEVRYYRLVNGRKLDCFSDLPFDENFWLK